MKTHKKLLSLLVILFFSVFFRLAYAEVVQTVDPSNKTAALYTDAANQVNFRPSILDGSKPVYMTVTDSVITGYAWGNVIGWVNLNSSNCDSDNNGLTDTGNFSFCTTGQAVSPFKVSDAAGTLSGYAWSQNGGWINFGPFANSATQQVTIDGSGNLNGYAWIQNYGWLQFACPGSSCVRLNTAFIGGGGGESPTPTIAPSATPTPSPLSPVVPIVPVVPVPPALDCSVTPNDPACILPAPPSSCIGPACLTPTPAVDCSTNPSDPACLLPAPPSSCIGPACLTPTPAVDCSTNPSDPACQLLPPNQGCAGPDCVIGPATPSGPVGPSVGPSGPSAPSGPGGSIQGVINAIISGATIDNITQVVNNPTVSAASKVVSTAGLVAGTAVSIAAALFVSPVAAPELVMIPFRLWSLLLSFLGIRKQVRKWGTVYDSITMQPLDPAYVVLKDDKGNEISTSLTDLDGRYGFPVEPGVYTILANKTDYQFPSAKLLGRDHDTLHKDLYFGDKIVVRESGEVITKNIPMDRLNFNWNEWAKNQKNLMKYYSRRNKIIAEISSFFFGVGFTVATVALIFAPVGYNVAIFALYVLLFILRNTSILKAKKTGSIADAQGNPLSFAIVRVYSAAIPDVEITHRVADKFGRFYCLVPNGNYVVKIDEKTGEETYNNVFTSAPLKVTKGLIETNFKINR